MHAKADVFDRVCFHVLYLRGKRVVVGLDSQEQPGHALDESIGVVAMQRAGFIDGVDQRPRHDEHWQQRLLKVKIEDPAVERALGRMLDQQHKKAGSGVAHERDPPVDQAQHQGWPAVVHGDDGVVGIDDVGLGAGEADEQQAGEDGGERHAGCDLDVAVQRGWRHDAVADGRQGFHAEEEHVEERARCGVGDGARAEDIERGEQHVDGQPGPQHRGGEGRPGQADGNVIGVAQIEPGRAQLHQAEVTLPDRDWLGLASAWSFCHAGKRSG